MTNVSIKISTSSLLQSALWPPLLYKSKEEGGANATTGLIRREHAALQKKTNPLHLAFHATKKEGRGSTRRQVGSEVSLQLQKKKIPRHLAFDAEKRKEEVEGGGVVNAAAGSF
jgi:hypothetical protein